MSTMELVAQIAIDPTEKVEMNEFGAQTEENMESYQELEEEI